jgi:hypothetical protein
MIPSDLTSQRSFPTSQLSFRAEQADFSESVRSCERIGLRSEESLFGLSSIWHLSSSAPPLRTLRLCVIFFLFFSLTTHYSLFTTHWFLP